MGAIIVDGRKLARSIEERIRIGAEAVALKRGRPPCLAVLLVGENPASKVYVGAKAKTAHKCGFETIDVLLPSSISDIELRREIEKLNHNPKLDGILLQLPLPAGLDESGAIRTIRPELDVDGLHPVNQGMLLRGEKGLRPCTPSGIIELIDKALCDLQGATDLSGKKAVILGRSILVGKPVGLMLLERNCTVTYCHSKTANLAEECRQADILIAAVGKARLVKRDWVRSGSIVIDVGINRESSGTLVGDVDFGEVSQVCAAITPVPGGVGPMTIAMLLSNTLSVAESNC